MPSSSPGTPPPKSDEEICAGLETGLYRSSYDKAKNPCTCSRSDSGTYDVYCNYDYCGECEPELLLCAKFKANGTFFNATSFDYVLCYSYYDPATPYVFNYDLCFTETSVNLPQNGCKIHIK